MSIRNQYAPIRINTAKMKSEIIEIHKLVHSSSKDGNLINPTSSTYEWLKDISFDDLVLNELPEILKELTVGIKKIKNLEKSRDLNIFERLLDAVGMPKLGHTNSIERLKMLLPVFIEHYALFKLNGRSLEWAFYDVYENHIGQDFMIAMDSLANHGRTRNNKNSPIALIRDPSLAVHLLA